MKYVIIVLLIVFNFASARAGDGKLRAARFKASLDGTTSYGNVNVGSSSSKTLASGWVCDPGPTDCTNLYLSTTAGPHFSVTSTNCNQTITIPAGGTMACSTVVKFAPTSEGLKNDQLATGHSGCGPGSADGLYCDIINLTGTGYPPPPPPPSVGSITGGSAVTQCPLEEAGSIINVDSQTFSEFIPLTGLPFELMYASNRVLAHKESFRLRVPIFGASANGWSRQVQVTIGSTSYPPALYLPNQTNSNYYFTAYTGVNADGSAVSNVSRTANVRITDTRSGFQDVVSNVTVPIGTVISHALGFYGWTLSMQHHYDVASKRIYYGDGRIEQHNLPQNSLFFFVKHDQQTNTEIYFHGNGSIAEIKHPLSGNTIYKFNYMNGSSSGRLSSIVDAFGKTISFTYNDVSNWVKITNQFGQVTTLAPTAGASGYLATVTNPYGEQYNLEYWNSSGLLRYFKKDGVIDRPGILLPLTMLKIS